MKTILITLFFMIAVIVYIQLNKINRKLNFTGAYAGFCFGLIVYYSIIPILIIVFEDNFTSDIRYISVVQFIYNANIGNYFFGILLIMLGFFSFNYGYKIAFKTKIYLDKRKVYLPKRKSIINKSKILEKSENFAYITFFIGIISLVIVITSLGGIEQAFSIGEAIRGFNVELSDYVSSTVALLYITARAITVSTIIFYFLILNRQKMKNKILFFISMIFSIIFYIFNAGRAPIIFFLLIFCYMFLRKYKKKVWGVLIGAGVISLPILDVLDKIFAFFQTGIWQSLNINYISYIYEFSHPLKIILNIRDIVKIYGYSYGSYLITDILNLLPGVNFKTSYVNTSLYIKGASWRNMGGIPNDIISYGYIQLGIIGVVLLLLLVGFLIGKIDKSLTYFSNNRSRDLLSVVFAVNIYGIVSAADLMPIIQNNLILMVFTIIVFISRRYL